MMRDPLDELEAAAARYRKGPEPDTTPKIPAAKRADWDRLMQIDALVDEKKSGTQAFTYTAAFLLALVIPALLVSQRDQPLVRAHEMVAAGVTAIVFLVSFFAAASFMDRVIAWRERRHLRGVRGLDVDRYLGQLIGRRHSSRLFVRIQLAGPIEDADGRKAAEAMMTWAPDTKAAWSQDRLVIDAGKLNTSPMFISTGGGAVGFSGRRSFSNQAIHRAFLPILAAVKKLDGVHRVERIETEVEGEIAPYEEDAES